MPILIQWENNERTIINVQFVDNWTWSEFASVRQTIFDMLESVPHIVDFIADFRQVDEIPGGALVIGRSIHKSCPRKEGVIVIVGTSPILRMLFQSFVTAYPASKSEVVLVPTLDDAHQTLTEIQQNRNNK